MGRLGLSNCHLERQYSKGNPRLCHIEGIVVFCNNYQGCEIYASTAFVATGELAVEKSALMVESSRSILMPSKCNANRLSKTIPYIVYGNWNEDYGFRPNSVSNK